MPNAERLLTALLPPPLLLLLVRSLLLIYFDAPVGAADEGGGLPPSLPGDNGKSAAATTGMFLVASALTAEPQFPLKVLVRDMVTRQLLPGALVGIYVNHSLSSSTWTGEESEVLLWVPYIPLLSLTLVATMEGYVPSSLPWTTTKRPIFSAVTLLLLPQRQGNIWLFEDSVVITAKLPGSASQPKIKIPKNLLTLPDKNNMSSLTAYLTVPQLAKDCVNCTPGFRSTGLKPVAAVSVLLYAGGEELQVRGPIQFSMPLGSSTHHRASETIPAWSFNLQTGAWENQGLGIVKTLGEELVWTYTASHLGYWIAAPLPSNDHGSSLDFLSYHTLLSVGILAGTLVVVIGFLSLLLCQCGSSHREPRGRRARFSKLTVVKKDQTTSMHMEEGLLFHSGENILAPCNVHCDPLSTPRHKANYNIYVEDPASQVKAPLYENISTDHIKVPNVHSHYINNEEVSRLMEQMELNRSNINSDSFFPDKLVHIYNHSVAIIPAPDIFGNQEPQKAGCKSATFPRNGNEFDTEAAKNDSYGQTLGKMQGSQQQSNQDEPQPLETPPPSQGPPAVWGHYSNLLESSVSVPGTLNEAAGMEGFSGAHGISSELQGISERTLLELTRGKSSSSHPRAWFVSLDGKPAAQVRHSIIELQSRRRPPSSNDTSLDSGVDMNEPQQNIRDMRRERTSMRASSVPHHSRSGRYGEDQDLSSSESGTTATDTPEDHSLRNILDGSSGAIPNIPEEQDGMDTSSTQEDSEFRETPPPRRLKKGKEKMKSEKRSTKHVREGRPLTKRR
ncbi:family with sequence similarity 171 member B [Syngnathoides biaculeatus]|uniref:family with sequence similarity 171 member B n=1 Tax=Syngnathoides biaculeatus TaxID=300417 RepID=UPI002ADDDBC9|nr:family with sequence similarity 171 member B [Syngnathoides biaculeatus]